MATILLVLPTGTYRADAYLSAAAHLGVEVIVGSEAAQALAASMGDRFVELPLSDPRSTADAIVAHARRVHLDAVVSVDDEGLVGAALAAERLGLRHSPPAAVAATRDKAEMRRRFAGAGVPQPAFALASPGTPREVERETAELGPPVVVKPATLSGSRGVIRADSAEEAGAAARRIAVILEEAGEPAGSTLVVEKFLPGPEVAVEAICTSGAVSIVAVFDKPDPLDGPYFEETFYVAPSRLGAELLGEIEEATAAATRALGLTDGPLHAELRVPGDSRAPVRVLEVAARTIGGRCAKALRLEGGASLEELVIATAAGLPSPPPRLEGPAGVLMIPIARSGRLVGVHNTKKAASLENIIGVEITIPPGRHVRAVPEGDRYLGFVFAAAATPDAVESALRKAASTLEVEIVPDGDERGRRSGPVR